MNEAIKSFNSRQTFEASAICDRLAAIIDSELLEAESKIWHAHPVWFLDGNPTVGYSEQKPGIRLMFWSGADFEEPGLNVVGQKFKDASVFYNDVKEIRKSDLQRWLKKAKVIQYNYRDIRRNRGLQPLKQKAGVRQTRAKEERH